MPRRWVYRIVQRGSGGPAPTIGRRGSAKLHRNTLQWLFASDAAQRSNTTAKHQGCSRWQEWLDGRNRPAIDEALELSAVLRSIIAQSSAKS